MQQMASNTYLSWMATELSIALTYPLCCSKLDHPPLISWTHYSPPPALQPRCCSTATSPEAGIELGPKKKQRWKACAAPDNPIPLRKPTSSSSQSTSLPQFPFPVCLNYLCSGFDSNQYPVCRVGGKTPAITPSPHPDAARLVEEVASEVVTGVSRNAQATLKQQYLRRDGHKCILSGLGADCGHDFGYLTQCAHIIPFGLGDEKSLGCCRFRHCICAATHYFIITCGGNSIPGDPLALSRG